MTYAQQLEREAEQDRARLADTLAELRASMTPGRVIDEVADYAGNGDAGDFFRGLKHQVARNPLPVTVIGAGVAWLAAASALKNGRGNGHAAEDMARPAQAARDAVNDARRTVSNAAGRTSETIEEMTSAAGSATREASRSMQAEAESFYARGVDKVGSTYGKVSDSAAKAAATVGGSASALGRRAGSGSRALVEFCREQPLVLAGIGLALGAALGALLPSSDAEDRLMGTESDAIKEHAKDNAIAGYEDMKETAEGIAGGSSAARREGMDGQVLE